MKKKGIPFVGMVTIGMLPGFLKRAYYRACGAKLGRRVKFGLGSFVSFRDALEMGDDAKIGPFSFAQVRTLRMGNRSTIGAFTAIDTPHVEIGADSIIMEQVVVGGLVSPRSKLVLGKRVKVFPFTILNPTEPLTVDDEAAVGGNNAIFTHGSWKSKLDGYPVVFEPVHIKKRAWLPWRVLVMPGVTIGEDATVGGGSVVTKSIPDRHLAAGVPARVIKEEFAREVAPDEQHAIVIEILEDLAECLVFQDCDVTLSKFDDGLELAVTHDGTTRRVRYERRCTAAPALHASEILITLERLPDEVRAKLEPLAVQWFDLAERACSLSRSDLWSEVRGFFGRYGVRFDVVE